MKDEGIYTDFLNDLLHETGKDQKKMTDRLWMGGYEEEKFDKIRKKRVHGNCLFNSKHHEHHCWTHGVLVNNLCPIEIFVTINCALISTE
jgi:hypothetical protein